MRHTARRPAYQRAAVLLVALLSAVLLGGVQRVSCEMHGLGAASTAPMDHTMMSGHSQHEASTSHRSGDHEHGSSDRGCDCSCIGECTMVAPVANAPAAAIVRVALVAPEPRRLVAAEPTRAPPPEPDRLLPFANGPPASAIL